MNNTGSDAAEEMDALLAQMDLRGLAALRTFWRQRWGPPPKLRSAQLLRHLIAWRLQAEAWGGLAQDVHAKLRSKGVPRVVPVSAGTRLVREYRGVLHEVECTQNGVTYQGRQFRSLSAVASYITGTHWNGPRFFGLRQGGRI